MPNVFAPQVFFIAFRECLEASVVISVLLSFLKQSLGQPEQDQQVYKRLVRHVWIGAFLGIGICLVIGGAFIGVFYGLGHDIWANAEDLWEGIFYLIACIIITGMGLALLRINKTKEKWRVKIAQALVEKKKGQSWLGSWSRRYVMLLIPLVTTLREGLEAVVFIGGVSLGYPATAFPIPVITGLLSGFLVGWLLYRGGNQLSIKIFLIIATAILYLLAAGMFSKAVWSLQYHTFASKVGGDVAEAGNGIGSYDVRETVWHVDCCNPETDNGWDVFNALLGWQNTATYGSVISYNVYWMFITFAIACMLYEERTGHLPLKKPLGRMLGKIPGIGNYIRRKRTVSQERADELVREGHEYLQTEQGGPRPGDKIEASNQAA
ncbi:high-affinity iron transporter [Exophiala aquamarina CBS 119918]|uniref:High-affinity iron transporter n=1 Tax=Exophiala aquamarina CBS 119918 TaxID=1182545 RepID=A0A072P4M3_9EURO|nr:high-affinity iron transporter [Exophiala aquamarina CBS 119918]KEF54213.1 high-affinity iron transporter [Exophiala aquamarina CBS 119918]